MAYNLNASVESQDSTQHRALGAQPLDDMSECESMSKMIPERVKLLNISEEGSVRTQPSTGQFD